MHKLLSHYMGHYKRYLYLPLILFILALLVLANNYQKNGDFINRDISLKGGVTLTVLTDQPFSQAELQSALEQQLSPSSVSIRTLESTGQHIGFLMESDIQDLQQEQIDALLSVISAHLGTELAQGEYSIEQMGSSLGNSFFIQTMRAMILAFLFMGIVVFLYFRTLVPSLAVIISAASDIIVTVAIVDFLGVRMGTAGLAALLMLIGYSIDTDILLTTRILKRGDDSLETAMGEAFRTGMTMTLTTLASVTVAFFFTQSEVIRQIMTVLLVGLLIDIINTWVQNAGLLLWYVEWKKAKASGQGLHGVKP